MCLMATTVIASATDVWTGEQAISWENTLNYQDLVWRRQEGDC